MKLSLACVWFLTIVTGCKTDANESPAASTSGTPDPGTAHSRSGKIDLPRRRAEPSDPGAPEVDRGSNARGRWADMRERRKAELDTNKDGTVSPEELAESRKQRAETMRKRLDKDGDGKLTLAELGESRMARRIEDLAAVDTNKDGDITSDELSNSLQSMRPRGRNGWGSARGSDEPDQ